MKILNKTLLNLALVFIPLLTTASAAELKDFLEQPLVADIKISPTGDYLAVKMFSGNEGHWLRFVNRQDFEVVGGFAFEGAREVGEYYWANPERVVFKVYDVSGSVEGPRFYGDLFAVNHDGSKAQAIFGFRTGGQRTGSLIRGKETSYAWGDIVDVLPDDNDNILISSTPWTRDQDGKPTAVLLDVYNGRERGKLKTALYPFGSFYTDRTGQVRLVKSYRENRRVHVEMYPNSDTGWIVVDGAAISDDFQPVAVSHDLQSTYVFDYNGYDKLGLHKLSFADAGIAKVYVHERVDITEATRTTDGTGVYAMRVDDGQPSYLLFSNDYEDAEVFKKLLQTFPGQLVDITSRSDDGKLWVVKTQADIDPGSFYLYDKEANRISLLFKARPSIEPKQMAPMKPVEFASYDGTPIHGYLTKPANLKEDQVAPMVVLIHGGPRVRDYWGFDSEAQALAANGYSVLQINYRGSSGYGRAFLEAGNRHWGDHIQQDIIAGTRWAIEQGVAKAGKICIMGASFGAYSALQSSILAPDLFTCAIANAGIYDLAMMYTEGDIEERYIGEEYLEEVIGRDQEELAKFSPVRHAGKLKTSLLIAHGTKDHRAPYAHAQALIKALDEHDKPYELFIRKREAHGFYDAENRIDYYSTALKFLDKHLK